MEPVLSSCLRWLRIERQDRRAVYLPWIVVSGPSLRFCDDTVSRLKLEELFSPITIQGNERCGFFSYVRVSDAWWE